MPGPACEHEAGYDAYLTGQCYAILQAMGARKSECLGKLHLNQSMMSIALASDEADLPAEPSASVLWCEVDARTHELLTLLDSMADVGQPARLDRQSQQAHHPDLNCLQSSRGLQSGGSKRGGVRVPLASLCRDHGESQAAKDAGAIDAAIRGKSEAAALEYLRHQIDMRVMR